MLPQFIYSIEVNDEYIHWSPNLLFYFIQNAVDKAKEIVAKKMNLPLESLYYKEDDRGIYTNDREWLRNWCDCESPYWSDEILIETNLKSVDAADMSDEEFDNAINIILPDYDEPEPLAHIVSHSVQDGGL